jgi:predicted TIM-barrel fold metal-dependent hydrolase
MIIDVHHHVIPLTLDRKAVEANAERRWAVFTGGSRAHRIDVPVEEIRQRLLAFAPDPHGEKLLERMAKAGIDMTILCVTDSINRGLSDEQILSLNRTYADIAAESHGKIIALAGIEPRRKKAPELFRRCIEDYGMRGLKWHPDHGYSLVSEEAYAVLKVAEELGTPMLTHTGPLPTYGQPPARLRTHFCDPVFLDDVTQDFPGLKVIAAHMGRFRWRDWAAVAEFRRNLYGDLAMWQILAVTNYELFCRELRDILDIAGSDSVLFGSDGPGFDAIIPNKRFIQILRDLPHKAPSGLKFTSEEVEGILGGNARKVFNI